MPRIQDKRDRNNISKIYLFLVTKGSSKGTKELRGQLLTQSFSSITKHSSSFKLSAFLMVNFIELAHVTVEELKYAAFLLL